MSRFVVKCKMWTIAVGVVCLIHLLWCVVKVHSQTEVPYLTFMKETIPNNSYVHLRQLGQGGTPAVITCNTNLSSCCRNKAIHGGCFFPNGTALPDGGKGNTNPSPIAQRWLDQRIRIQRGPSTSNISAIPSGIYQCDIAISDSRKETFYVGIYEAEGGFIYIMYSNIYIVVSAHICLKLIDIHTKTVVVTLALERLSQLHQQGNRNNHTMAKITLQ